ncbi:hypothetical protein [Microbispora sp. NPDC049125]|uniref:hypothetical protein n=1 Tax=Microbispora sp. NPDC049125 TaxID=3154929 RepID=UPI0034650E15
MGTTTSAPRTPTRFDSVAKLELLDKHPPTRDMLNDIRDPEECFVAASRIARETKRSTEEMDDLRERRRRSLAALHYKCGWNKMDILRWITPEGEKLDRRVVDFAIDYVDDENDLPEVLDDCEIQERGWDADNLPEGYWSERFAQDEARETTHLYIYQDKRGTTAREVMRVMVQWMTSEEAVLGKVWTNSELAKLSGYPSARIGQIRKGTTNAWKQARRAEERARNPQGRKPRARKAAQAADQVKAVA